MGIFFPKATNSNPTIESRIGRASYWLGVVFCVVLIVLAFQLEKPFSIMFFFIALIAFSIGRAARYILSGE
jgi:uncharacterized membrane protein YhaH (DUF805 family)